MTIISELSNCKEQMVPSIWNYFKSFYYSNTYIEPIDLKQVLPTLGCPDDAIVKIAKSITALPGVQQILSDSYTYKNIEEIEKKCEFLEKNGFRFLVSKQLKNDCFCRTFGVSEHPDLPNWLIKAGARRTPENALVLGFSNDQNEKNVPSPHESLLRVVMNQRIRQIIKEHQIDVIVPNEFAVPFLNPYPSDISQSYFVLSQKLCVLANDNAISFLQSLNKEHQLRYAKLICNFITKVGFADANFDNICFTLDGKIAIIDTEPMGLIKEVGDSDKGESVEKCARLGLYSLLMAAKRAGLEEFADEVNRNYKECFRNVFSIKKIAASIFCPILLVFILGISIINWIKINKLVESIFSLYLKNGDATFLFKEYYRSINGVLFPTYF